LKQVQTRPTTEAHQSHVVKLLVEYCNRILERADCLLRQLLRGARAHRGRNVKEKASEHRGREKGTHESTFFVCVCAYAHTLVQRHTDMRYLRIYRSHSIQYR
jgi:hypothetical protein